MFLQKTKRPHLLNRTTPNIDVTNKLKSTNNLYDVDETTSPPAVSSLNEMMDVDTISLNSTNNQHSTRTTPLENGINVTS